MFKKRKAIVVIHSLNGNEEPAVEFVEVDGVKYQQDPDNEGEALEKDGEKVPYVEKKDDDGGGDGGDEPEADASKMSMEDLAKINPDVAKAMKEKKDAVEALAKKEEDKTEEEKEVAKKAGKFQELYEGSEKENTKLKTQVDDKDKLLGKYKQSVQSILDETVKTIPKDKQQLIPEGFSPRQKLEYITQNANLLGATVTKKIGDKIDESDTTPAGGDEEKIVNELDELIKKGGTRTEAEGERMTKLSRDLKEVRAKKD